jgi:hypothetical protein
MTAGTGFTTVSDAVVSERFLDDPLDAGDISPLLYYP